MRVTSVRVRLASDHAKNHGLLAYATVELEECFLVTDVKILSKGKRREDGLLVSMPTRYAMHKCPNCARKVPVVDTFCPHCDKPLPFVSSDQSFFEDVCHPTKSWFREIFDQAVIDAWKLELERVKQGELAHA